MSVAVRVQVVGSGVPVGHTLTLIVVGLVPVTWRRTSKVVGPFTVRPATIVSANTVSVPTTRLITAWTAPLGWMRSLAR